MTGDFKTAAQTAKDYYDSEDADAFYAAIWGGEDIHVGLYESDDEDIAEASARTVRHMASKLDLKPGAKVIDIGSGYGGAARYLARETGAHITCLNVSEKRERAQSKDDCGTGPRRQDRDCPRCFRGHPVPR